MDNALILAGAVAKGAFEAGALAVLAENEVRFRRIVSSSAGSLNSAVFCAGVRVGRARDAAERLVDLWTHYASWNHVFAPSVRALVGLHALSSTDKIRDLLQRELAGFLDDPSAPPTAKRADVDLRIAVALLNGRLDRLGPGRASTYERVLPFHGADLDDRQARQRIIEAAVASAAFPVVFQPVDLGPGVGLALDGGAVDNTPIHEAIAHCNVERVFVVVTDPAQVPSLANPSWEKLLNRLVDILVNERLFRDMAEAYQVNDSLRALEALVTDGTLSSKQLARVRAALGWQDLREIEIVPIRPDRPLEGGAFSGFFSSARRADYIRLGRDAAQRALAR